MAAEGIRWCRRVESVTLAASFLNGRIMLLAGYLAIGAVGLLFGASKLQRRGQPWADTLCYYSYGMCDESQWLLIAAAFLALAAVAHTAIRQ
jgi:hypothetical protein